MLKNLNSHNYKEVSKYSQLQILLLLAEDYSYDRLGCTATVKKKNQNHEERDESKIICSILMNAFRRAIPRGSSANTRSQTVRGPSPSHHLEVDICIITKRETSPKLSVQS